MNPKKHSIDLLFIIALIGVFAVSSVMLTILGVNIYQDSAGRDTRQELNTASLYVAQKVRQSPDDSVLRIETIEGIPALVLESDYQGKILETWLFVYQGQLKEITSPRGNTVSPQYGQEILPLNSAEFRLAYDALLEVTLTSQDKQTTTIDLYLGQAREVSNE